MSGNWRNLIRFMCTCVCLAACAPAGLSASEGAVADAASADARVCSHPLSDYPFASISVAEASKKASQNCDYLGGHSLACLGGITQISSSGGFVGESWWFDANGKLLAYSAFNDNDIWSCIDDHYGPVVECGVSGSDAQAKMVALCPKPDASTQDTSPDSVDSSADSSPDVTADSGKIAIMCSSQSDCPSEMWCNYTGCGFTQGTCVAKPADCSGSFAPVCGCDGHSYDSACDAQKAGKAIAAYSAPCLGSGCAPACGTGAACVDCASAGVQCLQAGGKCVGGK